MSQPASKFGPVSIGGSEVFGNSQQGVFETLAEIQSSSKGIGEWIDGLNTGTGPLPEFAHDHRGGVWGRPLGVGHCVPVVGFVAETFLNVPDVSSPTGEAFPTIEINGGYQCVDFYVYQNAAAGIYFVDVDSSQWVGGVWTPPSTTRVVIISPGGGASWVQASAPGAPFQLPAGLIKIKLTCTTPFAGWEWSAFVIPQR